MKRKSVLAWFCALVMLMGMITVVPAVAETVGENGEIIVYAVNEDGKTYNSAFTKTGTWAIGSYTVGNRVSGYSKSAATFSFDMGTVAAGHYKAYYYSFKNAVSTDMSVKVGGAVAAEITLPNPGNTDSIADGWAMIGEITLKEAAKVTIDGSAAARNLRAGAVKLVPVTEDPEGTVIAYVTDEEGNLSRNVTVSPEEILEYSAANVELGWTWSNNILVDGRKTITSSATNASFSITFDQADLQRGKYQIQYYNYAQAAAGTVEMLLSVQEGERAVGEFVKPVASRTLNQNVLIEEWTPIGEIILDGKEDVTVSYVNTSGKDNARATAVKLVPIEVAPNSFTGYVNDYSEDNLAEHEYSGGTWSIADGKLTAAVSSGTAMLIDQVPELPANYEVSAEITFSKVNGSIPGLVVGATDQNNYFHWRLRFNNYGGQILEVYQFKNGEDINLYELPYKWYDESETHLLSVRVEGRTMTFCLDGKTIYTHIADVELGAGVGYRSYKNTIICDNLTVMPIEGIEALPENALILDNEDQAYTESGSFEAAEGILGRDGSGVRTSVDGDALAIWGSYPQATENYSVYYYNPGFQADTLTFSVATLDGYWRKVSASSLLERAGWVKLMTVSAVETTAMSVELSGGSGFYADAIAFVPTTAPVSSQYSPVDGGADTVAVLVNQLGYDHGSSMRATVPNAEDGTAYKILRQADGAVVYEGTVEGNIADFSGKLPLGADTDYYIVCGEAKSYVFTVGENLIYRRSVENALKFMAETRHDTFRPATYSIAWRDSSQYSFELNGLVLQYMANPSYYENMDLEICHADSCKFEELQVQDEPAIVWLIQFAALYYYDLGHEQGNDLHALIKGQLAYFLYVYPEISEYVSYETYEKIRDYTLSVWGSDACTDELFYNTPAGTVHDLYALQTAFGGFKGSQPPAHSVIPNLFMYEVALRDGLGEEVAEKFFTAAYENCAWLIGDEFDLNDPFYNKGQRSAETITIPALSYFLEKYPDRAPEGLAEAIADWAVVTIARANNMWDMRMAASMEAGDGRYTFHNPEKADEHLAQDYWTGAAYAAADKQGNYLSGGVPKNEPGNTAGLQAITYAAARVLENEELAERLKAVGVAATDDLYGRNPSGRAAFYHFTRDFEGGDLGWYKQYQGGVGLLEGSTAVIDGNAPEGCYPYNPSAYNTGYTEGWVTYNAAWNVSIAYLAADACSLVVSTESGKVGDAVTVTLNAPLNTDPAKQEQGEVQITLADGTRTSLTVLEVGTDSAVFTGTYTLPQAEEVEISYGSGLFKNACTVAVETDVEGDLDGNGTADTADVVLLLQYLVNKEVSLPAEADLNGDGRISVYDAVLLLQQIAQ